MTEEPRNLPAIPDRDDVARDIHYETHLDEAEPSGPTLYVDLTRPSWTRLPIVPEQLRRENLRGTVARVGGRQWHAARFHGLRVAGVPAPGRDVGAGGRAAILGRLLHWWHVTEQHGLRSEAAASGDSREWMKLHKEAKETRRVRASSRWPGRRSHHRRCGDAPVRAVVGVGPARRRRAAAAGPGGPPGGPAHHRPGGRHAAVRKLSADIVCAPTTPPGWQLGQGRPGGHLRLADGPRRRGLPRARSTCPTARASTTR